LKSFAVLESLPTPIQILDSGGRVKFKNAAFKKFVLETKLELNVTNKDVVAALELGQIRVLPRRIFENEGKKITIETTLFPLGAAFPNLIGASHRDVSFEASGDLFRDRYKILFDSDLIGFCITSQSGLIVDANAAYLRMLEYTREDLLEGKISWHSMVEERNPHLSIHAKKIRDLGYCPTYERQLITKSGKRIEALVGATESKRGESELVAFVFDLTEIKTLQRKINDIERLDALGHLAGGVAHDFNNILSVIMLHLERAMEINSNSRIAQKLSLIQEHSFRAKRFVQQLLTFSKNQIVELKPIQISSLIENMRDIIERIVTDNISIKRYIKEEPYYVKASATQLEQVLLNLVTNARDAMPNGGTLSISTYSMDVTSDLSAKSDTLRAGKYILLEVSDTGAGIDEQTLQHIFEPFYSTKESGRGTGLGLSTVYGIVKQSSGHVEVVTKPGMGTTFKVFLPVAGQVQKNPLKKLHSIKQGGKVTVLVVEDQPELREILCSVLSKKGLKIIEASTGEQALNILETCHKEVQLIITDIVMPQMSGPTFVNKLKQKIPILYISGYSNDELKRLGMEIEMNQFLSKPFSSKDLLEKVSAIIGQPT